MFALKQLGMPIEFNHQSQNERAMKQNRAKQEENRPLFASEASAHFNDKITGKVVQSSKPSPAQSSQLKSSSLKQKKPPIQSKIDNKRGLKSNKATPTTYQETDMNADLGDLDYTTNKSPINSKYQLTKQRGAQYANRSRSSAIRASASAIGSTAKLAKQNEEIKALLSSEHIQEGDRVLDELGALKSN